MVGNAPFLKEFKKRRIFKFAAMYLVAAWAILQTADVFLPILNLPDWALKSLLVVMITGFPIVLLVGWLADVIKQSQSSSPIPSKQKFTEGGVISALFVLSIYLVTYEDHLLLEQETVNTPQPGLQANPIRIKESIAVLPFANFSPDQQDEYFADGLTEEILNVLAKVGELKVAARTSSFAFKNQSRDIREIAQTLNVEHILEGSVRRNQNQVRVTAQLIQAETGFHLWSNTFDFEMRDVFAIQDKIAKQVADALQVTLLGEQQQGIATLYIPENMQAYSLVKKAEYQLNKRTQESIELARDYFKQAIALDAKYPQAYSGLAMAQTLLIDYGGAPAQESLAKAKQNLEIAHSLDAHFADLYAVKGLVYMSQQESELAAIELEKAIQLNPSHAMATMWLGNVYQDLGEANKGSDLHLKAAALDPLSPVALFNVANDYFDNGQIKQAMSYFSQIVSADPNYPGAYKLVANISNEFGRLDESLKWTFKQLELNPDSAEAMLGISEKYWMLGELELAVYWLERAKQKAPEHHHINRVYAMKELLLGNRQGYIQQMRQLANNQGSNIGAYFINAELDMLQGNKTSAMTWYQKIVDEFKAHGKVGKGFTEKLVLAGLYLEFGDQGAAAELFNELSAWLESRKSKVSHFPSYHFKWAQLYAAKGEKELALESMQQAIDAGWMDVYRFELPTNFVFQGLAESAEFDAMLEQVKYKLTQLKQSMDADLLDVASL